MAQPDSRRHSSFFVAVATLFVTCLIVSNVIAVKLAMVQGVVLPAAIVIFPVSYLLADVLTEVYGYRAARRVIWLGFFCNLLAVAAIWVGGLLPAAPFWGGQVAYEQILGATPRILLASFIAYLAGEFANTMIMSRLKLAMAGRHLWARAIGSTLVGQGLDSAVFISIAFSGLMPLPALLGAIVTQWLVKSAYEALATPLTYAMVGFLKRREGIDTYDRGISFNPFALGD
ncbi:MAG TPA: queuosine precursor transporter [Dongiaceae bacterium]|nr:queuosine precursor transporter [Dongiaceae bacterium]